MLVGKRINLIILEERHLESLRQLRNDPTTLKFLTHMNFISSEQQKKWFQSVSLDQTRLYMAIEDKKGNFLGLVRSDEWDRLNRSVRIGVDIVPKYRGKGFATEAYELFIPFLFDQQNMNRIWLLVADFNSAAIHLYEKLGFEQEGIQTDALYRDNRYCDYVMMSLLKGEYGTRKA